MTDVLREFLLARIAEDESIARRAAEFPGDYRGHRAGTAPLWTVADATVFGHPVGPRGSVEATPGRVLAECRVKRRLVEMHEPVHGTVMCAGCDGVNDVDDCPTLWLLASLYADHPDFRGEWAL